MPDFLLELLSEEIPARMQAKARDDLARLFAAELGRAGLKASEIVTYSTPRRLALIARGLPAKTAAVSEEIKGPRASAPPQALEGFLRKTGLAREQLVERDGILFALIDKPGRPTAEVLAEAIPAIVRAFPWPKSMRWGEASLATDSPRWVRPLQGIVALLGEQIVDFEIAGIRSGAATVGHRFHHPGVITIGSAGDYAEKLRACHVIVDPEERESIIALGATTLAAKAGLDLIRDEGLLAENAGLTEWPVPLLGGFDPAFLEVPPEVIQLTMRTNQKYFALKSSPERGGGPSRTRSGTVEESTADRPHHHPADGPPPRSGEDLLAPHFICTANLEAADGGASTVAGNQRVLSARLSDAKFFWEHDLKIPLEEQAKKLGQIVFHEKLGTVGDKVDRVAKLARWLVEEGIVKPPLPQAGEGWGEGPSEARLTDSERKTLTQPSPAKAGEGSKERLADLAETAARLAKADLVTGMVGEFPELQGVIGGYLARAQGEPAEIADAIRDHYKPVGQGDEVPTAPVTVAVSLADKLDSLAGFFAIEERPTGSKDPFALRRAAIGVIQLITANVLRLPLEGAFAFAYIGLIEQLIERLQGFDEAGVAKHPQWKAPFRKGEDAEEEFFQSLLDFFADRLKVQQREAGVRHDLIDAVFALGGEDDLVRLLARVKALQAFVETGEGADLLAGYKRAANILKKEGWSASPLPSGEGGAHRGSDGRVRATDDPPDRPHPSAPSALPPSPGGRGISLSYTPENEEAALIAALDSAEPRAREAVAREDFEGAMAALASLRAPVDSFFDKVTVNDPDPAKREARLGLLARMRDAVHAVADFSKIEG